MGFFGLIMLSGMVGINKRYYEAASLDGADAWQRFWRIALPLCAPTLATLAVTTFMESRNDYPWPPLMLTDRNRMSNGKSIGTATVTQQENKWVIAVYEHGFDLKTEVDKNKDTATCFVDVVY